MMQACINCKYFESRTNFCRKDPPKPIVITEDGKTYIASAFAKISMPQLDYCFEFKPKVIS